VYYFVTHINRRTENVEGAINDINGAINTGTKTTGIS
jgi:hypothetical protein